LKAKPVPCCPFCMGFRRNWVTFPKTRVPIIASELNLTRAEVHGVVTFYHDFRSHPAGRHIVKVCQAESCQAAGSAG
jgi:formate dehydrogenase subunit gamma